MNRFQQILFVAAFLAICWLLMMAVHELGHVIGASFTGGEIQKVVLHPLSISRTDVAPNPQPGIVVWLGPIVGVALPVVFWMIVPRQMNVTKKLAQFFASFCLIANGVYISIGAFDRVGDCKVMLETGSPVWVLIVFGIVTIPVGLYLWHRIGSVKQFFAAPAMVSAKLAYGSLLTLAAIVLAETIFCRT